MLSRNLVRYVVKRRSSTRVSSPSVAKYPPILDLSEPAKVVREREKYRDKVNSLDTVEEKLFYTNMDYYYGSRCFVLQEGQYPVNFLPFVNFVTRTRCVDVEEKQLHQMINFNPNEAKELVERIRPHLQEVLLFELLGRRREEASDSRRATRAVVERINDILLSSLSMQYQHLLDAVVDYEPRVEAFWLVGDFHPPPEEYKARVNKREEKEKDNKWRNVPVPIDIIPEAAVEHKIQYQSHPLLQLRSCLPLTTLDTSLIGDSDPTFLASLADVRSSPALEFGLEETRRHGVNLPGFWPGDDSEFGLVSFHHMANKVKTHSSCAEKESQAALTCQAVLNGFSWLHSQACLQGFSSYSELTYPLASQQVITDGRRFLFNLYQLNTTICHKVLNSPNRRTNICATLPMQTLYEDIQKNQFVGWNDSVVLNLLAFYLNKPAVREGVEMKPHVNPAIKHLSDIDDDERRTWLHNRFRHMYSNRPRHRLPYEIYDWERIYKITFNMRQMDAKTRPFEHDQDPLEERKLYDIAPPYVPRKFRDNPKKKHWNGWKAKRAKTYFPDPK